MSGTPRLRSAYPSTPRTTRRSDGTPSSSTKLGSSLPDIGSLRTGPATDGPLIPFETIDAPQQRLYVVAFYIALLGWRLYDFHYLQEEETESLWMFMKWVAIDGAFLFGLPELRIPWLEWSSATMTVLFLAHALLDGVLMFRIPIPLGAGLVALSKLFYDRELAISERHVKHSSILHNSSLILGKQIIHILPEGSATLNPGKESFCLDSAKSQIYLPIQINQTTPIGIDLLHVDLETNQNNTVHITSSQIKKLVKEAKKNAPHLEADDPLLLRYPVKVTGMYLLQKVVDESKLEVRRKRVGETFVVTCPRAIIKPLNANKCKGELSGVEVEVTGTPPLRIKYRKMINRVEHDIHLQSIQPDDFVSPLSQQVSDTLVQRNKLEVSWARPQSVDVQLSESMTYSGDWVYAMEEVEDAFGNTVSYVQKDHENQEKRWSKAPHLHQKITVHERPTAILNGCSPQRPLRVAEHAHADLPVQFGSSGRGGESLSPPYQLEYLFTPENEVLPSGEHSSSAQVKTISLKNAHQRPRIQQAGLYSLKSISTSFCRGEVLEPASCLLQNPPRPEVTIESEEITDKCKNKAIGLRVNFHLTGTPPFNVMYQTQKHGSGQTTVDTVTFNGLRGQIDLTPSEAGSYSYTFRELSDATYKAENLHDKWILTQDVKPSAHASFMERSPRQMVCIDQSVAFDVALRGEGPFKLEYELSRGNDRKTFTQRIEGNHYRIATDPLTKGGDYTLALASVTDNMECKEYLKEEAKINVRHQKPKAGFGQIEGGRSVKTLEGKKISLPLRLTGEGPWNVQFRDSLHPDRPSRVQVTHENDKIDVSEAGTYEIISVNDRICPGVVDESARSFEVSWIPRPTLQISKKSFRELSGNTYIKHDVCEGEDDAVDLQLSGSPPFEVKYEERLKSDKGGHPALRNKALNAALGVSSIRMDTSQAGLVEYKFSDLGDYNYDHDRKHFSGLTIQQRVSPRPTAHFTDRGKTYSYCSVESAGEEVIPITLSGQPPFILDVEVKPYGSAKPDIITIPDIPSTKHNLRIPHSKLHAGNSAVSLRKISDSRGCSRILDSTLPRVQISVHDAPIITPLELQEEFCVGDRISFALSGTPPYQVYYEFNGVARKASVTGSTFRRIAETAGTFVITGVTDAASACRSTTQITRHIHGMPSVRVEKGRESVVDIHEGGEAEIMFDFEGTPPFEFTWTRSTNARKGQKSEVLETRNEASEEYSMTVRASEEGTYEVVAIKDRHCAYAKEGVEVGKKSKLLTY